MQYTIHIKKNLLMLCAFVLIATSTCSPALAYTITTIAPYAAILDYNSNTVIFERNLDEKMFPSSMSKLMTLYVIFSKIRSGAIKETDVYRVSEEASQVGGSTMFLTPGQKVSVHHLINGVVIASGNDASLVLAEGSAGNVKDFIEEMNGVAQKLGMYNSQFMNVTGWPHPDHYTTPRDLLILARSLFEDFPEYTALFSQKEINFNQVKQKNRNTLLWTNSEVTGLKTGYTESGGYGMVLSAIRDNRLVIIVLNGLKSESSRHQEARKLLDYAFSNFESKQLFEKGEPVHEIPVWMGKKRSLSLVTNEDVVITYNKKVKSQIIVSVKYLSPLEAPIFENQKLATLTVKVPGASEKNFDLFAQNSIESLSSLGRFFRRLSDTFSTS